MQYESKDAVLTYKTQDYFAGCNIKSYCAIENHGMQYYYYRMQHKIMLCNIETWKKAITSHHINELRRFKKMFYIFCKHEIVNVYRDIW